MGYYGFNKCIMERWIKQDASNRLVTDTEKTTWNGKANASHNHTKSQITDFPSSLKNPNSIIIKFKNGSTEGTDLFTYDGSASKTINITSNIGAYSVCDKVSISDSWINMNGTLYAPTYIKSKANSNFDIQISSNYNYFYISNYNSVHILSLDDNSLTLRRPLDIQSTNQSYYFVSMYDRKETDKKENGIRLIADHTNNSLKIAFYNNPGTYSTGSGTTTEMISFTRSSFGNTPTEIYITLLRRVAIADGIYSKDGKTGMYIEDKSVYPYYSDIALGSSTNKWTYVYATNGTIQTSNELKKTILESGIDNRYEQLYEKLEPIAFKWNNETADGSNHDRVHLGLGAQTTKHHMNEVGITAEEYALYCEDTIEETNEETGEVTSTTEYGINYGQLHALHIHMIQKLLAKVDALEKENDQLEYTINQLLKRVSTLENK